MTLLNLLIVVAHTFFGIAIIVMFLLQHQLTAFEDRQIARFKQKQTKLFKQSNVRQLPTDSAHYVPVQPKPYDTSSPGTAA